MANLTLSALLCISFVINTSAYIEDIISPFFKVKEGGRSELLTIGHNKNPTFFSADTPLEPQNSQVGTSSNDASISTDTHKLMDNNILGTSENWYPLHFNQVLQFFRMISLQMIRGYLTTHMFLQLAWKLQPESKVIT
ncbi:hypothetical protein PPACK8108_LOCUS12862 [Phakopsora pachyrhizi]|uniref:Uncharacterized protein n=1 Tax=Phakopsora pachyrhizi TaxID=170000 RepID=A0AAV0B2B1_PHAPC|nr:hypothetical protein PPACK8108_LOCUS12862 [Phakopsora pachyrhizi]